MLGRLLRVGAARTGRSAVRASLARQFRTTSFHRRRSTLTHLSSLQWARKPQQWAIHDFGSRRSVYSHVGDRPEQPEGVVLGSFRARQPDGQSLSVALQPPVVAVGGNGYPFLSRPGSVVFVFAKGSDSDQKTVQMDRVALSVVDVGQLLVARDVLPEQEGSSAECLTFVRWLAAPGEKKPSQKTLQVGPAPDADQPAWLVRLQGQNQMTGGPDGAAMATDGAQPMQCQVQLTQGQFQALCTTLEKALPALLCMGPGLRPISEEEVAAEKDRVQLVQAARDVMEDQPRVMQTPERLARYGHADVEDRKDPYNRSQAAGLPVEEWSTEEQRAAGIDVRARTRNKMNPSDPEMDGETARKLTNYELLRNLDEGTVRVTGAMETLTDDWYDGESGSDSDSDGYEYNGSGMESASEDEEGSGDERWNA